MSFKEGRVVGIAGVGEDMPRSKFDGVCAILAFSRGLACFFHDFVAALRRDSELALKP